MTALRNTEGLDDAEDIIIHMNNLMVVFLTTVVIRFFGFLAIQALWVYRNMILKENDLRSINN